MKNACNGFRMAIINQMETMNFSGNLCHIVHRITPQMRFGSQQMKKTTLIIKNFHFKVTLMLRSVVLYWELPPPPPLAMSLSMQLDDLWYKIGLMSITRRMGR